MWEGWSGIGTALSPWLQRLGWPVWGQWGRGHVCHQGPEGGAPKETAWRISGDETRIPHEDSGLGDSVKESDNGEAVSGSRTGHHSQFSAAT